MEFKHVIDQYPTFNKPLSAKYLKCFAYKTFKERVPSILQNIIDDLEDTEQIKKHHGEQALLEVDNVITQLKNFQSSIKSDKPMKPVQMTGDFQDEQNWYNKELQLRQVENDGNPPSWFQTDWLFAECYFYFKMFEIFHESKRFEKFDPFHQSKVEAFVCSKNEVAFLSEFWYDIKQKSSLDESEKKEHFVFFMKCALWGNQADLSLSQGKMTTMKENMLQEIGSMDHQILSDDTDKAYDILNRGKNNVIDIVLDNAGFELFNDLIFADYLVTFGLANKVIFHVKKVPWFVSDVTPRDFEMQFQLFESTIKAEHATKITDSWADYLRTGKWSMKAEAFWVLPFDCSKMAHIDAELYAELSKSTMVIFKGDLNYRKLVGDIYWVPTTSFRSALRGFEPTNVLALRTIKADTVSGLAEGVFEELNKTEPDWMRTGRYALIQVF